MTVILYLWLLNTAYFRASNSLSTDFITLITTIISSNCVPYNQN